MENTNVTTDALPVDRKKLEKVYLILSAIIFSGLFLLLGIFFETLIVPDAGDNNIMENFTRFEESLSTVGWVLQTIYWIVCACVGAIWEIHNLLYSKAKGKEN